MSCLSRRFWVSLAQASYLWGDYAKGSRVKKGGGEEEAPACLLSLGRTAFTPVSLLKNAKGKRFNACNHMLPWKQAHERDLCVPDSKSILVKDTLKECLRFLLLCVQPTIHSGPFIKGIPSTVCLLYNFYPHHSFLFWRDAQYHLTDGQYKLLLPFQQLEQF